MANFQIQAWGLQTTPIDHSQQKCPNSAYGSAEKKTFFLFEIYFLGMVIHQSNSKNTLCKCFMKFTKSKNKKHTGWYQEKCPISDKVVYWKISLNNNFDLSIFNLMDTLKLETPLKNPTSSMRDCFLQQEHISSTIKTCIKINFHKQCF